jgi:uncharacterized membrane protein
MPVITKSIIINVPVTMAYNQWTQFEEFPHFMEGVVQVTQIDDTTLHWVAEIGGRREEWEARITEQLPDEKIAWRSESGAMNSGVVTFQPINASQTKISLEIEYNPSGVVETVGDMMGYVSRQVEANLRRFKEFIESRDRESGAWRGKVA